MKAANIHKHNSTDDTKQHITYTLNAYYEQVLRSLKIKTALQLYEKTETLDQNQQQRLQLHEEITTIAQRLHNISTVNIMHTSLITKIAQAHSDKAKTLRPTARNGATKLRRSANSDPSKRKGSRNISRRLTHDEAKPLMGVKRDHDTTDGGKKGEITTNPNLIDLVQRA